ncbi:MAG: hypothetical protein IJQ17_04020 [Oscillospiraceae bacterium]|nr:hypothetical protein [Oscillospiraceae bacterium]
MHDAKALQRLQRGDEDALAWLMDRYTPYVHTVVCHIMGQYMSQADMEEVDTAANTYLTLHYETYSLDGQENTAQNVLALYGGGDSVSVSGHEGVCFTGDGYTGVRWVDTDACLVFALTSDALTPVELVQLAQSVA